VKSTKKRAARKPRREQYVVGRRSIDLPEGVKLRDLKSPLALNRLARWFDEQIGFAQPAMFEMWYTERFGWCIPTLLIRHAGHRARMTDASIADRTYAVRIPPDGLALGTSGRIDEGDTRPIDVLRVGAGPHVLARVTVYVAPTRSKELLPFLELRKAGSAKAHEVRDRISTRRIRRYL